MVFEVRSEEEEWREAGELVDTERYESMRCVVSVVSRFGCGKRRVTYAIRMLGDGSSSHWLILVPSSCRRLRRCTRVTLSSPLVFALASLVSSSSPPPLVVVDNVCAMFIGGELDGWMAFVLLLLLMTMCDRLIICSAISSFKNKDNVRVERKSE